MTCILLIFLLGIVALETQNGLTCKFGFGPELLLTAHEKAS